MAARQLSRRPWALWLVCLSGLGSIVAIALQRQGPWDRAIQLTLVVVILVLLIAALRERRAAQRVLDQAKVEGS